MHVQIGVGYVLVPANQRGDESFSPPVGLSVGNECYENGPDPARKQE